jgi:hypothetical protein
MCAADVAARAPSTGPQQLLPSIAKATKADEADTEEKQVRFCLQRSCTPELQLQNKRYNLLFK